MATNVDVRGSTGVEAPRSRWTLRHVQAVLVVVALLVTGYMTVTKLSGQHLTCAAATEASLINCEKTASCLYLASRCSGPYIIPF